MSEPIHTYNGKPCVVFSVGTAAGVDGCEKAVELKLKADGDVHVVRASDDGFFHGVKWSHGKGQPFHTFHVSEFDCKPRRETKH